jgi:hypothetical protein
MSGLTKFSAGIAAFAGEMESVSRALQTAGWELRSVEADLVLGRLDITIHRNDGRWVHARLEANRCSVERWQREARFGRPQGRTGTVPSQDCVNDVFLGRFNFPTPVSAIRSLADYVTDNSPKLQGLTGRDIFRPALGAWHEAIQAA